MYGCYARTDFVDRLVPPAFRSGYDHLDDFGEKPYRQTNQEGMVTIPPIPQGTILVQIIAKDYQTFGQNFDVDEEQKTLDIKLNPPQPQYSVH
jgi:hypothetical protein